MHDAVWTEPICLRLLFGPPAIATLVSILVRHSSRDLWTQADRAFGGLSWILDMSERHRAAPHRLAGCRTIR